MKELFLIYVNELGEDWKGDLIYEFIFSNTTENVEGEDWDVYPASGQPEPPKVSFVKRVGKLESKFKLSLIQNSDTFAVWDAIDGVIALAWEDISEYEEYPDKRIAFHFGELLSEVEGKLYEKDLILEYKNTNKKNEK